MSEDFKQSPITCRNGSKFKVPIVLDGDTAIVVYNLLSMSCNSMSDEDLELAGFCQHTGQKFDEMMEKLSAKIEGFSEAQS